MSTEAAATGLTVAILGATGAVGRDLLSALEKSPFPIRELRLLASRRSEDTELSYDGRSLRVGTVRTSRDPALMGVDLAFFATPADVTRGLAPALAGRGVAVVDIGGALADQAQLVVPAIGLPDLSRWDQLPLVCTPSAPGAALATVLMPLREIGLIGVRGTGLLSAGVAGQAGIDELSASVVAMLNSQTPPRKVFPTGLAFDLVSPVGAGEAQRWSDAEQRLSEEVAALVEIPAAQVAVSLALVPLFAGLALSLHLSFDGEVSVSDVLAAFEGAEGVRLGDPVPGPRRLSGKAGVYVGRVRADPADQGIHLWACADNLRFGASGVAVQVAAALWREGRVGPA